VEFGGYAGLDEALGVGDGFVAQRVELADADVGGREAGQVLGAGRCGVGGDVGATPTPRAAQVEVPQIGRSDALRIGVSVSSAMDRVSRRSSKAGTRRNWKLGVGPPRSRANRLTPAERLAPALSPPTPIRSGSMPSSAAFSTVQRKAA
jgi:hypothetical protein